MIGEGEGICFWTRVRFPSGPLKREDTNPIRGAYLHCFQNVIHIVLDVKWEQEDNIEDENHKLSFGHIRRWVKANYDVTVSNGSITGVIQKCGMSRLERGIASKVPTLRSDKEKLVYEAFKHFNIV